MLTSIITQTLSTLGTNPRTVLLTLILATILPPTTASLYFIWHVRSRPSRHLTALLLVLGDIGRSPRMMYHAESFAKRGWETALVGYHETPLIPSLLELPHVHVFPISNPPKSLLKLPWVCRAPIRIIYQIVSVFKICLYTIPVHPAVILVQNPPSIPTLALARLITHLSRSKLIIDWHNTGYSILAMRTGEASPLVRIAKWFEAKYGRVAYAHLFVTRALQSFLTDEWKLQ
jgi:beta-1,4-mannosyltransferase